MSCFCEDMLETTEEQCMTYGDVYRRQQDQKAVRFYEISRRLESRLADIEIRYGSAKTNFERATFSRRNGKAKNNVRAKKTRQHQKVIKLKQEPNQSHLTYQERIFSKYVIGWRWVSVDGSSVEEQTLQYYEHRWRTFVYDAENYGDYQGAWKDEKTYETMVSLARAVAELRTALAV